MQTPVVNVQNENEYEDLLSLWSDLEAGLGVILASPASVQEFVPRVAQYERWMQTLLTRDTDVGLYLLFQLSTNSSVGYSASHALICAVLCHLTAVELALPTNERASLTRAALTMNIAITTLQDELALQTAKLSPEQQTAIRSRNSRGATLLSKCGVSNAQWLDIVALSDDELKGNAEQEDRAHQLGRILRLVDRYAAMISPRKSREGRSAAESMRSIMSGSAYSDQVGQALMRAVGASPPGTCVRLDDGSTAVVTRRSPEPNLPHVVIVTNPQGHALAQPTLHRTSSGRPKIQSAVVASTELRQHLNHHLILQLGAHAVTAAA